MKIFKNKNLPVAKRFALSFVNIFDIFHWELSRFVIRLIEILHRSPVLVPDKIIVMRNCFLGDFVVSIPALRLLRQAFPKSRIIFLTSGSFEPSWRDKLQDNSMFDIEPGLIDEVVRFTGADLRKSSSRAILRQCLTGSGSTASLSLCYSADGLRSRIKRIIMCWLLCIPFPIGLTCVKTLPFQGILNKWRRDRHDVQHQYEAALSSVHEFLRKTAHPIPKTAFGGARKIRTCNSKTLKIGLAPFSKQSAKQWPLQSFGDLVRLLKVEYDSHFYIYGSEAEKMMAVELENIIGEKKSVTSLCGVLLPNQLRGHLESVDLLICLDSGPMHVASLIGTPVVAVFPQITLHQFWRPWGSVNALVSTQVDCAQCDTRNGLCPNTTNACVNNISVEQVFEEVKRLLAHIEKLQE